MIALEHHYCSRPSRTARLASKAIRGDIAYIVSSHEALPTLSTCQAQMARPEPMTMAPGLDGGVGNGECKSYEAVDSEKDRR